MPQSIVLSCPVPHKTDETGREVCLNRRGEGGGNGWLGGDIVYEMPQLCGNSKPIDQVFSVRDDSNT